MLRSFYLSHPDEVHRTCWWCAAKREGNCSHLSLPLSLLSSTLSVVFTYVPSSPYLSYIAPIFAPPTSHSTSTVTSKNRPFPYGTVTRTVVVRDSNGNAKGNINRDILLKMSGFVWFTDHDRGVDCSEKDATESSFAAAIAANIVSSGSAQARTRKTKRETNKNKHRNQKRRRNLAAELTAAIALTVTMNWIVVLRMGVVRWGRDRCRCRCLCQH